MSRCDADRWRRRLTRAGNEAGLNHTEPPSPPNSHRRKRRREADVAGGPNFSPHPPPGGRRPVLLFGRFFQMYDFDRAMRARRDRRGNTPKQKAINGAETLRTHKDAIRPPAFSLLT